MDYNIPLARVLLPACEFAMDKKTKELTAENCKNPWKLIDVLDRRRS